MSASGRRSAVEAVVLQRMRAAIESTRGASKAGDGAAAAASVAATGDADGAAGREHKVKKRKRLSFAVGAGDEEEKDVDSGDSDGEAAPLWSMDDVVADPAPKLRKPRKRDTVGDADGGGMADDASKKKVRHDGSDGEDGVRRKTKSRGRHTDADGDRRAEKIPSTRDGSNMGRPASGSGADDVVAAVDDAGEGDDAAAAKAARKAARRAARAAKAAAGDGDDGDEDAAAADAVTAAADATPGAAVEKSKKQLKKEKKAMAKAKAKATAAASVAAAAAGAGDARAGDEAEPSGAATQAIEYLECWAKDRKSWKFKKVRQMWLLKNVYSTELIDPPHFKMLLKYVKSLQGGVRERTLKDAQQVLEKFGAKPEIDGVTVDAGAGTAAVGTAPLKAVAKVAVDEAVLARAQKLAYLLS